MFFTAQCCLLPFLPQLFVPRALPQKTSCKLISVSGFTSRGVQCSTASPLPVFDSYEERDFYPPTLFQQILKRTLTDFWYCPIVWPGLSSEPCATILDSTALEQSLGPEIWRAHPDVGTLPYTCVFGQWHKIMHLTFGSQEFQIGETIPIDE